MCVFIQIVVIQISKSVCTYQDVWSIPWDHNVSWIIHLYVPWITSLMRWRFTHKQILFRYKKKMISYNQMKIPNQAKKKVTKKFFADVLSFASIIHNVELEYEICSLQCKLYHQRRHFKIFHLNIIVTYTYRYV